MTVAEKAEGDSLDIQALILPCPWSYGPIAHDLIHQVADHPVYSEWFRFFASQDYEFLVRALRDEFDEAATHVSPIQRERLSQTFANATRLEAGFWDMAYQTHRWPDLLMIGKPQPL